MENLLEGRGGKKETVNIIMLYCTLETKYWKTDDYNSRLSESEWKNYLYRCLKNVLKGFRG